MTFVAIYLVLGLANVIFFAAMLTDRFVEETGCPRWKDRWVPVVILLWLPILIAAVVMHARARAPHKGRR